LSVRTLWTFAAPTICNTLAFRASCLTWCPLGTKRRQVAGRPP